MRFRHNRFEPVSWEEWRRVWSDHLRGLVLFVIVLIQQVDVLVQPLPRPGVIFILHLGPRIAIIFLPKLLPFQESP
jgi:hypothetical protein